MKSSAFGHGDRAGLLGLTFERERGLDMSGAEYLAALHKMFHTFAYDVREYVVEFLGASDTEFTLALPWLTYLQSRVYEMDFVAERALRDGKRVPVEQIRCMGLELREDLSSNGLCDEPVSRAMDQLIDFLSNEEDFRDYKLGTKTESDVFGLLELKTADLEILLRTAARLAGVCASPTEFDVFRRLLTIREVYDDIRDYPEDKLNNCFNVVWCSESVFGPMEAKSRILAFLDKNIREMFCLIDQLPESTQSRLNQFAERWEKEKDHYVNELTRI